MTIVISVVNKIMCELSSSLSIVTSFLQSHTNLSSVNLLVSEKRITYITARYPAGYKFDRKEKKRPKQTTQTGD